MQQLSIDGGSLEWFEQGEGARVIFVHGAPSDARMWQPHRAALATRFRAAAFTQRYFGTAPWEKNWPPFGIGTHAADLAEVIRRTGDEPVHVVAWSYGAHAALTVAVERPELVRSLLVYEPGFPTYVTDEAELAAFAEDAASMFAPVIAAVSAGENENAVRHLLDGSGQGAGYFESQPEQRRRVQLDNARVLPLLLSQRPPPHLSCGQLGRLPMPVCVACGALTRPAFAVVARAAARCIPGNAHIVVPGATHMWPEEDPRAFVDLVVRFIDSQSAPT